MSDNRPLVDLIFRAWSRFYDNPVQQKLYFGPIQEVVLEQLGAEPGCVLDLGCGTGELLARLRDRGLSGTAFGADISHEMLLKAGEKPDLEGRLTVADGHKLPFGDASFDAITCLISFQYYLRPEQALADMCRVLRPGGRLMLAALTSVIFEAEPLDSAFKAATDRLFRVYSPSELRGMLKAAGFQRVEKRLVRPFTRVFVATV